ncbi:MAG: roadblock/LC7 domain-containing protein [Deltaproteobacteria bacterium]|nr:roadblock/LC7 domain-containing protein [Deltaproteobacteria bacterium]MBW2068726.1 roadblock/LC7 domain-containing protein [Deltaproteobacteria bacterium]
MDMILTVEKQRQLEDVIRTELLANGAEHVILVDSSGSLIVDCGNYPLEDILPLAALSAANFGATAEIAKLVGEEDFTLLFHKGEKKNLHFSKIGEEYILIVVFDKSVSLGLIRLKSTKAAEKIMEILGA